MRVVLDCPLSDCEPAQLHPRVADVVVIDLEGAGLAAHRRLDALIEESSLPLMFTEQRQGNAATADEPQLAAALIEKLRAVLQSGTATARGSLPEPASVTGSGPEPQPAAAPATAGDAEPARIWVLGASIGGPQALARFLGALPRDVGAGFLLAQHIAPAFVQLLATHLARCTWLSVECARCGSVLEAGRLLVLPPQRLLQLDEWGRVNLRPAPAAPGYSPSIDAALMCVAERYGAGAGAVIFSGMGDDGARGCVALARRGGRVWVQDPETCVISTMVDHVRRTGVVSFSEVPERLAERLAAELPAQACVSGVKRPVKESSGKLGALLVPLRTIRLLLPSTAVAEVVDRAELRPLDNELVGVLGHASWRGRELPVIDFEAAALGESAVVAQRIRLLVMKAQARRARARLYALAIAGLPRLLHLEPDNAAVLSPAPESHELVLAELTLDGVAVAVPDLAQLETILELLP